MRNRTRYVGFGLPLALALLTVALFAWGRSGSDSAQAAGPEQSLNATGTGIVSCDDGVKPTKPTSFPPIPPKGL